MYAFNAALQRSWQDLFDHFKSLLGSDVELRPDLDFRHGIEVLHDPDLLFGQTCGYPLMTHLSGTLTPFCVPCFDVPGTDGKRYSSQLIVNAESEISALADCEGKIAAINTTDSNSGMNVLRYEVARIGASQGFFSRIEITGGHLHSLRAVAEGHADLAAIDCVTFQLIADQSPDLVERVRRIGFTAQTCGLPFVLPGNQVSSALTERYCEALQQAVLNMSSQSRDCLHLSGIEAVSLADYAGILELESYALEHGIAMLN